MEFVDYGAYVAERIAKLRTVKGVSARDMSQSIGQSVNYINHIENRKAEPSLSALFAICEYFGISPQEFFDQENQQPAELKEFIASVKRLDKDAMLHLAAFIGEVNKLLPKGKGK
jgi:transcriptional regulator with XRE-family HTH domain